MKEPTDDWTIEDLFMWLALKSNKEIGAEYETQMNSIKSAAAEFFATLSNPNEQAPPCAPTQQQQQKQQKQPASHAKSAASSKTASATIRIDVVQGIHTGESFFIGPLPGKPCKIGRSKGPHFRAKGVSLPHDGEVSTSHGQFEVFDQNDNGQYAYVDKESTNGSKYLKGTGLEELPPNQPLPLTHNMTIVVGGTTLKICLL
jgi:hypothetical protein